MLLVVSLKRRLVINILVQFVTAILSFVWHAVVVNFIVIDHYRPIVQRIGSNVQVHI